jgi:membrane associated rhomboid family serine protease
VFFFPINVDVPMTRLPVTNWVLISLICCISILGWANTDFFCALAGIEGFQFGSQPVFNPPLWRLPIHAIGSSFLHGGLIHLIGNMLFLWVFGNAINYKFGHLPFIVLYMAVAILSGLAFYCTVPGSAAVGASGAIMGIVGAYLMFFPRNDVIMAYLVFFIGAGTVRFSSWIMILIWFGFDLLHLVFGEQTEVAYAARVAGFLIGFGVAGFLAWRRILEPTPYEQALIQVFRQQ